MKEIGEEQNILRKCGVYNRIEFEKPDKLNESFKWILNKSIKQWKLIYETLRKSKEIRYEKEERSCHYWYCDDNVIHLSANCCYLCRSTVCEECRFDGTKKCINKDIWDNFRNARKRNDIIIYAKKILKRLEELEENVKVKG